jgi:hypothetical protein
MSDPFLARLDQALHQATLPALSDACSCRKATTRSRYHLEAMERIYRVLAESERTLRTEIFLSWGFIVNGIMGQLEPAGIA